jgi:hypothetical protein
MLRYQYEAADPALIDSQAVDPLLRLVVYINAPEFEEWRDGMLKQLDEIEAIMRAGRELDAADNGD